MVCKLVHPHSVLELSRVRCQFSQGQGWGAWAFVCVMCCRTSLYTRGGGGTGKTMTGPPPPPGTQHSCSPQLGSVAQPPPHAPPPPVLGLVAQPRRRGQNRCPVIHGGSACTVCAQCRHGRGLAHLVCRRQLCSRHATRCVNFAISSDNLAFLDTAAAHQQPLLVPLPPLPPFNPQHSTAALMH